MRGLLYPTSLPATRTRAEKFDALVLEALEPIELRWGSELSDLDLAVDEVPEVVETSPDDVVWGAGVLADVGVPLAQLVPAGLGPTASRRGRASCSTGGRWKTGPAAAPTSPTCCTRCSWSRWRST